MQAFGVGPVKANTILFNWNDTTRRGMPGIEELKYMNNLKAAFRFGLNLIILDGKDSYWPTIGDIPSKERKIDIWWQDNATGRLMLLLAYLMTRNESWEDSKIRVFSVQDQGGDETAIDDLKKVLEEARIAAEPEVVDIAGPESIIDVSGDSSVVFIPFKLSGSKILSFMDTPINDLIDNLQIVTMVLAGKDIDLDAEPETGKQGELAEAADKLSEAEKKVKKAEEKKIKADKEVEQKKEELGTSIAEGSEDEIEKKLKQVEKAEKEAEIISRREAKAVSKLEDAVKDAESLGIKTRDDNSTPVE